jgi:Fe-S-cluster-containing dehydrogenase component
MTDAPINQSRRNFLKVVSAGALSINTAACLRKPAEAILPFARRPEDLVPGQARYFATCWNVGESVQGLLVRSTDGRPTKVEGNPNHPMSRGASSTWAQASVLELYSPERSRTPLRSGAPATLEEAEAMLLALGQKAAENGGAGLTILLDARPSPTLHRLLAELKTKLPKLGIFSHDGVGEDQRRAGARAVGLQDYTLTPTGKPRVIALFDADPLGTEGDVVAFGRLYAEGRDLTKTEELSRIYSVEPHLSLTGANADHRLARRGSQVGEVLAAVARILRAQGLNLPELPENAEAQTPFASSLAEDLLAHRGRTLVLVGHRQPAHVHSLGLLINQALGNFGQTLQLVKRQEVASEPLSLLAQRIDEKTVDTLVVLGGNPAFDAAGGLGFADKLGQVSQVIHLGMTRDETGAKSAWHVPRCHYLEAWGDLRSRDGTVSVQQPLISPLYPSLSELEVVARLLGRKESGYTLVRETHAKLAPLGFEKSWQRWLHDGVITEAQPEAGTPEVRVDGFVWRPAGQEAGVELDFVLDPSILDGRFAPSPWLQELPDPITKLVWDNAALVSPASAARWGLKNGTVAKIALQGKEVEIGVWIQPGTADDVVILPLGYGRTEGGKYGKSGVAVGALRPADRPFIAAGATLTATSRTYDFASTQLETSLHDRPHVRSATKTDFIDGPNFVQKFEIFEPDELKSLWEEPNPKDGHQWGMAIDLNACTACGACTVACQAENNIPWVGKEEVKVGRELHWIRIDRYFEETQAELQFQTQPMACAHCETAPCENVCPVGATAHSPEGLNDMAYNRCIGTRYCSNNCPYKVRRFNFLDYANRNDADYGMGIAMQRNPDVTVRFRGVMEKCTYCVQKISRARIDAKVNGDGNIKDGAIVTACQSVCPTQAITFGNLNDPNAKVVAKKAEPRNYAVAAELNIRPRTTYLAKISNPNPKLSKG